MTIFPEKKAKFEWSSVQILIKSCNENVKSREQKIPLQRNGYHGFKMLCLVKNKGVKSSKNAFA